MACAMLLLEQLVQRISWRGVEDHSPISGVSLNMLTWYYFLWGYSSVKLYGNELMRVLNMLVVACGFFVALATRRATVVTQDMLRPPREARSRLQPRI